MFNKTTNALTKVMPTGGEDGDSREASSEAQAPASKLMEGMKKLREAESGGAEVKKPPINKYKMIGKHIDTISFIVFSVVWSIVTFSFVMAMAAE